MTILVTGGAGYIGSHVVHLLGKRNEDLIILDDLSTGRKELVTSGELVIGDVGDENLLEELFKKHRFNSILHFAGSIIVPESVINPLKYFYNNTQKSLSLIRISQKFNCSHFIFSSTAAVYGIPEEGKASEETPLSPINPYGRSKLMTEWMLKDVSLANKEFHYIALRYFNVAGANMEGKTGQSTKDATHLIKIAAEVVTGKRSHMEIYGTDYDTPDGTCIRDYIHADDLAQAHLDALEYLRSGGQSQVLNCGYGHGTSVRDVLSAVKNCVSRDFKVVESDRRPGDAPALISEAKKIREILGWRPKYDDLDLIVKSAIDWEEKLN